MTKVTPKANSSIVALDRFIQAIRDSGYKGTSSAVAELVDNSLQAGANRIDIRVVQDKTRDGGTATEIFVGDDGAGMDPFTLRQALRFGGSTRFNDRSGLGRYGMGLPSSSLSQARRVAVYTWKPGTEVYMSFLDLDEIAENKLSQVPVPRIVEYPIEGEKERSGTLVHWSRCDRLDYQRASTIARKMRVALGRRFRYFLWHGVEITINGETVESIDPLFLHPSAVSYGAQRFGEVIEYAIRPEEAASSSSVGSVSVQFSELPVHDWHGLSNDDKREMGISKGAGVSIVRAGREVDYGWFFLGSKRRENYDDWWRCEVQFDPVLDEAFGLTHTKQQVRPLSYLMDILTPDIEAIARTLNSRARHAHVAAKAREQPSQSEELASRREKLLVPLPAPPSESEQPLLQALKATPGGPRKLILRPDTAEHDDRGVALNYEIVELAVSDRSFYSFGHQEGRLTLALNPSHPFYKHVYKPLLQATTPGDQRLRTQLELMLLSLARTEAAEVDHKVRVCLERHRLQWSNTLATFLNG